MKSAVHHEGIGGTADHIWIDRGQSRVGNSAQPAASPAAARLTPPSSPKEPSRSAAGVENPAPLSSKALQPGHLQSAALSSHPVRNESGLPLFQEPFKTEEPSKQIPAPPPYLPLRKSNSQRLRLRAVPPYSSPLNENGSPRAEQLSPTLPKFAGRPRQGSAPRLRTDLQSSRSPLPSPTSIEDGRQDDSFVPRSSSLSRTRGQTTSHVSPQHNPHPLRSATSIPDYGVVRNGNKPISPAVYRTSRSHSIRDSYRSSLRRDPHAIPDSHFDEVRGSYRSAVTTASSGFLDASGTERSSVLTKDSSTSDLAYGYPARPEAEMNKELRIDGKDGGGDAGGGEEEEGGMSVEDAITMYECGFYDDPADQDSIGGSDEGYVSQAPPGPTTPEDQRNAFANQQDPTRDGEERGTGARQSEASTLYPASPSKLRNLPHSDSGNDMTRLSDTSFSAPAPRDRYGFKKATQYITVEEYDSWNDQYIEYTERRRKKWVLLMKQHGLPTIKPIRFPPRSDKVKRYIRKGIPPEWRGAAWFYYAGGPGQQAKHPNLYWEIIEQVNEGKLSDSDREQIERDLNRTFPDNIRFKPESSMSHESLDSGTGGPQLDVSMLATETPILRALRRVLQAFAVYNPSIGYCQSLNFLAGLLLLFLEEDEEKAWIMLNIITTVQLPGTHSKVLEANVDVGVLMTCIRESMPAIWTRIDDTHDLPTSTASARLPTVSLATTSWFMSLFVGNLPIETVLRVWDSFFYEGSKSLFRIALAIFKIGESDIRSITDHMEIFQVVQGIPRRLVDANALMEACFKRRNGFGHLSQETIDARRAERRKLHAEDMARITGSPLMPSAPANRVGAVEQPERERGLRRASSKARIKRSLSKRRARNVT